MSSGGIFKLLANDGLQDKLLMASEYLSYRIKKITQINRTRVKGASSQLNIENSWLPDMNMISKTHVIFTNGTFKPFVASGFEYNKTQASGLVNFGSKISFSVPSFGDYINDVVVHVKLTGLAAVDASDRVCYAAMLGHKLFKEVSFKVNSNPLDSYVSDDYNAYFQFHVPPAKRIGWLRNMGQEIPNLAYLTADPTYDLHRELKWFGDGNQTFKQSHDEVDLWIPLLFWFKKIESSLPNAAIPYGQTTITIDMASASEVIGYADYGGGGAYTTPTIELMEMYMNNIFMNPEVSNILLKKFGFSLIRVHGRYSSILTNTDGGVLLNTLKWPTETLYAAFRPQSNANLSQYWHKASTLTQMDVKVPVAAKDDSLATVLSTVSATTTSATVAVVSGLALVATTDYTGYDINITAGKGYSSTDPTVNRYYVTSYVFGTLTFTVDGGWNGFTPDTTTVFEFFTPQLAINVARYYKETPTISTIEIKAHGVVIYRSTDESFYNSYIPYRFGDRMNTPSDRGWYMINFNFNPGEHQPSGHINLSRVREFYLNYTSSEISKTNPVGLVVLADLINFLLVKDGSAVLRYST
jgi:hypothetical protein